MYREKIYKIENTETFKTLMLGWAEQFNKVCCLNSNSYKNDKYSSFDFLMAAGEEDEFIVEAGSLDNPDVFGQLKNFYEKNRNWLFGFLTYDLKNKIENLSSKNFDGINMPEIHFFQPEYILFLEKNDLKILSSKKEPDEIFREISGFHKNIPEKIFISKNEIKNRISKTEYLSTVEQIKKHIHRGDIYEMNFCQEFFMEAAEINSLSLYLKLNAVSPTPFSCFYKYDKKFLISASPERFFKKIGNKIISQPIKGTIRRGATSVEDESLKQQLLQDKKEQTENVMITDLVRNDLSKTANPNTVNIEELFGIYTFQQVHQMITTISSELRSDVHFVDAIRNAFPMGSMTGAPKIRAMELIEKYESTKRGLFSGAVGYITPGGDFDFNVVIRSILYDSENKYLSFMAGGAITANSLPEKEYEECLLKAKAIFQVLDV